jgi:CBS domain-containing protein
MQLSRRSNWRFEGHLRFDKELDMSNPARHLTAAMVMQRDIITVTRDDTLRDALALMTENHVTGLPVMDKNCRCIGLITSTDILNYEQEHADGSAATHTGHYFDAEMQRWVSVPVSAFGLEELGDVGVSEVMSSDLIWVDRDTPLTEVARRMLDERVHRVLVMDSNSRLYGIISAYDFVRVIAEG